MASTLQRDQQRELCEGCSHFYKTCAKAYKKNTSVDVLTQLGSYERIEQRRNCLLCRLVIRFLTTWVSGTSFSHQQIVLSPRFGVSEWAILCPGLYQSKPLGWIRVVHPSERIPLNDPKYRDEAEAILRQNQLSFKQVRSWLSSCSVEDGQHYNDDGNSSWGMFAPRKAHKHDTGTEKLVERVLNPENMLLIDVVDECLVLGRLDVDFVAMSYVWGAWGGANVTETTKESLEFFCRKGGLRGLGESIPCVIRDAMALVRGIGQRYLWCDLLCVVSDNLEVKKSQIEMMDVVYSEASLTIIALTGLHGNMELPGVRPGTREPICLSETLENGARFLTRHVPLTSFYDQTKYTKRGWTFQEELLSRKCLYITNRQMYFKCGLVHYREDESLFSQNEDESVESCLNSFPAGYSSLANVGQNFDVYCELLSEYSRRQLTFDDDILKAFEGITSILAQKYQSEFLEGLPVRFLSDALLWIPSHHTRRRLETDPSEMQTGHPPTWSWAAWDGRVTHLSRTERSSNRDGRLEIPPSNRFPMLEGFLFGNRRFGAFQISDICTSAFVARVRRILGTITRTTGRRDRRFTDRLMISELNNGGWSTEPPTGGLGGQIDYARRWSSFGTHVPRRRELSRDQILQDNQFDHKSFLHPDASGKWWPFDYMQCLHPDDPGNWWPLGLAVPSHEQISTVLRHVRISQALGEMNLTELPKVSEDFSGPPEVNPPLCFLAPKIYLPRVSKQKNLLGSLWKFTGGQLMQESKGTLSSTFTTRNGRYDCKMDTIGIVDFSERKYPLDKHTTWSETPTTVIFRNREPSGILFDFEDDVMSRLCENTEEFPACYLIEVSRINRSFWDDFSNVMLIRKIGDGYVRVAVGQVYSSVFERIGKLQAERSWIRLY